MSTIEVKNLKKYFGNTHAVNDISFSVEKGEIFGFLGPNGAGKTTTIKCLMNYLYPTSGEIKILNEDINKNPQIKNKIGYLSGDVRLYNGWTGEDHINFFENLRGQKSNAANLMQELNLNPKIKFKNLSSGNKQKLGLIIALMFNPELIIMDEPTVGLDPLLQNTIYELLEKATTSGTTIFMSSHNLSEVDRLCNRVGIIKEGKLLTIESVQNLKDKRLHTARVHFNGPFDRNEFIFDNIQIQKDLPEGLELGIKGDINPLITKLANYSVRELEITHANLEDIFLEFYGKNNNNQSATQNIGQDNLTDIPRME